LRSIGELIAKEAADAFGVQISANTVRAKAGQIAGGQPLLRSDARKSSGSRKITVAQEVVREIDRRVKRKQSIAQAAEEIAAEFKKKPAMIQKIYRQEKERSAYQSTASHPAQFAEIAILQLGRISKDDDGWEDALRRVEAWIENFRSKK
jgi:hypothetical protein